MLMRDDILLLQCWCSSGHRLLHRVTSDTAAAAAAAVGSHDDACATREQRSAATASECDK